MPEQFNSETTVIEEVRQALGREDYLLESFSIAEKRDEKGSTRTLTLKAVRDESGQTRLPV